MNPPKIICTICARGGSKELKGKNLLPLLGRPLMAHSIIQARDTNLFAAIAVSSDSEEIRRTGTEFGAGYAIERPAELATDQAPKIPAIRHCVETVEKTTRSRFDIVVDLDATSPLRSAADIKACVELLIVREAENVVTGVPSRKSPYFNMVEVDEGGVARLSKRRADTVERRQDAPLTFDMNASIYVWRREILESNDPLWRDKTVLYPMRREAVDIDTELDFELIRMVMEREEK